jgi:hypothetical protein
MDGPRLVPPAPAITTDATLKTHLRASLAAASSNTPVSNAEIRAKLLTIEAALDAILEQVEKLLEMSKLLAENDANLALMVHRTVVMRDHVHD